MNLSEEKAILRKGIASLNAKEREIQVIKLRLETCLDNDDMIRAEEVALELNNAYEKQTQTSRNMPLYLRRPNKIKEPDKLVPENEQARVGFTKEGWFCAIIPALLPKKEKGSPDYIRNILYSAMIQFFRDKDRVRYTDCVLAFKHVYDKKRSHRRYRDHDNIEINAVIDVIALYVLHDDNPAHCDHYQCAKAGEQDETQIFVVPRAEITKWIVTELFGEKKEIILYEKLQK